MNTYKCPLGHTFERHAHVCPTCLLAAVSVLERIQALCETPSANPEHFKDKLGAIAAYCKGALKALGRSPL